MYFFCSHIVEKISESQQTRDSMLNVRDDNGT